MESPSAFKVLYSMRHDHPLRWREILGLSPLPLRLRQALFAIRGDANVPGTQYDLSSLQMLNPKLALPLWRGRTPVPRKVVLTNFFNHTQTPIEDGWSVKRTQTRDYQDGNKTYDSHNGTDFCIPVGTVYRAAASGTVVRVVSEFHRGGLKVAVDHGGNLMTSGAHLARALVKEGEKVERGQPLAITGYSGLDAVITFPFGIPHVHLNVWFNGKPTDPFARSWVEEESLWRGGTPTPIRGDAKTEAVEASVYNPDQVAAAIASCVDEDARRRLQSIESPVVQAGQLVFEMAYFPTRFREKAHPYKAIFERSERLSMPFSADDFDGWILASELP